MKKATAPNPWQIYSTMVGWRTVSGSLTAALSRGLKAARAQRKASPLTREDDLFRTAYMEWWATAKIHVRFGAIDTEPCDEATIRIHNALKLGGKARRR